MSISAQRIDGKTFSEAFADAEKQLKRFERIGGEALETAINQLRYASRHYLEAEKEPDSGVALEVLKKAVSHCRRAQYDAIEAAIVVIGKSIVSFTEKFLRSSVLAVMPEYPDNYAEAVKLLEVLRTAEAPRIVGQSDIDAYGDKLERLISIWVDMRIKLPLVEKLDEEKRMAEKTATRRHVQNVLLTILGISVAVAIAVVSKIF